MRHLCLHGCITLKQTDMTPVNCKEMVCALLEDSELNTIIDQVITSKYVSNILEDTNYEKYIPRAVLSVAIKRSMNASNLYQK